MGWLERLVTDAGAARTVLILCSVIALGLMLGQLKLFGLSLGIAGVLFAGLVFGHFQLSFEREIVEFARDFGMILFVFTIGLQVGPSFFASFRRQGVALNLLAAAVVGLGVLVALVIGWSCELPTPVVVGLLSGAVTNTPGLGAAQQALGEQHVPGAGELSGLGYAVAYPFGIIGTILVMLLVRWVLRIDPQREAAAYEQATAPAERVPENYNIVVANPRLEGTEVRALARLVQAEFVISRLLRGGDVVVPEGETRLRRGDVLHVVCTREHAEKLAIIIGDLAKVDVRTVPSELTTRSMLVTRREAVGKSIRELDLMGRHHVAITRVSRAGIELVARAGMTLNFGDRVTVVGAAEAMPDIAAELGDSVKQLLTPNLLPIFVGIILGVVLGNVPVSVPGVPAPVKLGLAGGPLLVAIVLSRVRRVGPLVWYLPQSANLVVREIGIALFLACVGLKSGTRFLETLTQGDGLRWIALAALITVVPILIVGFIARIVYKLNYLSLCGLLAGSMTDPPALSFAGQMTGSDAPAVTYATVYALVVFLRILTAQALVLMGSS